MKCLCWLEMINIKQMREVVSLFICLELEQKAGNAQKGSVVSGILPVLASEINLYPNHAHRSKH